MYGREERDEEMRVMGRTDENKGRVYIRRVELVMMVTSV